MTGLMKRSLVLTAELVARCERPEPDPGPNSSYRRYTDEDYQDRAYRLLRAAPPGSLWVFAYGSLIWKPVFAPVATMRATALGWERAFTLRIKRFRGTPECPGLMMQIDRGGTCEGVLHIVPREAEWEVLSDLWRREMTVRPPGNLPRWIEVEAQGEVWRVIAFTANPASPNYAGRQPPETVAACLAEACGHWGSGADYLLQTVTALEREGIHDPHLWELQGLVADLIERRWASASPSQTAS